jgi:hypothetical protein
MDDGIGLEDAHASENLPWVMNVNQAVQAVDGRFRLPVVHSGENLRPVALDGHSEQIASNQAGATRDVEPHRIQSLT